MKKISRTQPPRRHSPHRRSALSTQHLQHLESRLLLSGLAFGVAPSYYAGAGPHAVVTADFNGDGKTDLAVTSPNYVNILLNQGGGTFAPAVQYAGAPAAFPYLVAGDFNGDGKIDLAAAAGTTLSVLLNNGNGTFAPKTDYGCNAYVQGIVAADFNGDQKLDLAVVNSNSKNFSVFRNNGNGTFAAKVDYAIGGGPVAIAAADFDGDGRPDIAVAEITNDLVDIFRNNGDGTFAAKVSFSTPYGSEKMTTGDFNADGKIDLAVTNYLSTVAVFLGNGNGTLAPHIDYAVSAQANDVIAADFTGDGKTDLVTTAGYDYALDFLKNNGDGTFAQFTDNAVGSVVTDIAAGDFNGDGKLDIASVDSVHNTVSIHFNPGTPVFSSWNLSRDRYSATSVIAADFNNDGHNDLAVADYYVTVVLNNGNGTFAPRTDYTSTKPITLIAADFNGDGKLDIASAGQSLVAGNYIGNVSVMLNAGNGLFAAPVVYVTGGGAAGIFGGLTAADFNGDGKTDLATVNAGDNKVTVLLNLGNGSFGSRTDYLTAASPQGITSADFNGDGKTDLAVTNFTSNSVSIFFNTGNGTFAPRTDYATGINPRSLVAVDLNRDGRPDLAIANTGGNSVSLLLNIGNGTFATKVDYATDPGPETIVATDLNLDGNLDLITAQDHMKGSNNGDNLTVLPGNGNGTFGQALSIVVSDDTTAVTAADFNGDAKPDLAVVDGLGNGLIVIPNKTVPKATPTLTWTAPASITYGTPLSSTQLNASASVPGTFSYSSKTGAILPAGSNTLSVTFTPTDTTNYAATSKSVTLTVTKATPVINWSTLPQIFYHTPLPASDFNASSTIPGTFSYSRATGDILTLGSNNITATFTPTDTANYNPTTKTVSLNVIQAVSTVTLTPSANPTTAGQTVTFTASVTAPGYQPTGSVQFSIGGLNIGLPVPLSGSSATFSDTFGVGNYYVQATYSGDTNTTQNVAHVNELGTSVATLPSLFPPIGNVDSLNTTTLAGWTLDKDASATSLTVRIDIDGATAGTTTANLSRPDLVATYGSANHGFSYTLPTLTPGLHKIDIYALDSATSAPTLLASKELNTNQSPTGWIDILNPTTLAGWAYDPNTPTTSIQLRYQIDSSAPQLATASLTRPDLAGPIGSTNHGFFITLPQLPAGAHTVTVWLIDPSSKSLTSMGARPFTVTNPTANPLPKGHVDLLSTTQIAGWAYDPSNGPAAVQIRIDIDGTIGTPFTANLSRPDLVKPIGSKFHGFSNPLTLSLGAHKIDIYALDLTTQTPTLLTSQIVNNPAPKGHLDVITQTSALGWAYLPGQPGSSATIRIDIDNALGSIITANASRPDLTPLFGGPNFGFTYTLPKLLAGTHSLKLYIIDPLTLTQTLLASSTFIIT